MLVGGEAVEGLTADDYLYPLGSEGIVPEIDAQLTGAIVDLEDVLAAGDDISLAAAQNSGGSLNVTSKHLAVKRMW